MIFYDKTEKRRYLIRFTSVVMLYFLVAIPLHFLLQLDSSGLYASETSYESINLATNPKNLVLTFDDGPNPEYTPQILNILDKHNISAVFFCTGSSIQKYPELIKEIYDRGHIIGSHSYTHSEDVHINVRRLRREINLTNGALGHAIGYRTILYRPPFLLDLDKNTKEIISDNRYENINRSFNWLIESGYIIVDAEIDSKDWMDISEEEMIAHIYSTIERGQLILFHDSGDEDRSKTVSILPKVIEELQSLGYKFISMEEHLGIPKKDLMPETVFHSQLEKTEYSIFAFITKYTNSFLTKLFYILLILSSIRLGFIFTSFIFNRKPRENKPWEKGVSVLVPAYNEEDNIKATIQSILLSTYKKLEIIVVDDGSSDNTSAVVKKLIEDTEANIKLIFQKNGGKASALNNAIEHAIYPVLFAIDSDTVIHNEAIEKLSSHFNDESVGAVAGKIEAITDNNPITIFQSLEYTTSQNLDKVAFDYIGAVNIVPGAIGAWRRVDVLKAGGYNTETLVEDQDLTLAILKNGKKVIYEPEGIAYTEVPKNTKSFFKQRYRWIYGTFQCLWKYKSHLFGRNISLGWIILPYNIIFMAIVPLLIPITLGTLTASIILGGNSLIIYSFFTYLMIDIIYYVLGVCCKKNAWLLIISIPFQRLYYKMIITIILMFCCIKILEGTKTFWNKLERSGSAQRFFFNKVNSEQPKPMTT